MSIFSNNIVQVDAKKRQQDREALIAAAQRNVTKSLHGMDEKVFRDTGKVAPSLLSEWEAKAHAAAQAKSDTRMENYGKVHIGGGQFINQSAVDLVAARNVQPVLDEINEKAEVERERQATIKAEKEEEQRKGAEKKAREREEKEINKKLKRKSYSSYNTRLSSDDLQNKTKKRERPVKLKRRRRRRRTDNLKNPSPAQYLLLLRNQLTKMSKLQLLHQLLPPKSLQLQSAAKFLRHQRPSGPQWRIKRLSAWPRMPRLQIETKSPLCLYLPLTTVAKSRTGSKPNSPAA
jgi:hypothetical protein